MSGGEAVIECGVTCGCGDQSQSGIKSASSNLSSFPVSDIDIVSIRERSEAKVRAGQQLGEPAFLSVFDEPAPAPPSLSSMPPLAGCFCGAGCAGRRDGGGGGGEGPGKLGAALEMVLSAFCSLLLVWLFVRALPTGNWSSVLFRAAREALGGRHKGLHEAHIVSVHVATLCRVRLLLHLMTCL